MEQQYKEFNISECGKSRDIKKTDFSERLITERMEIQGKVFTFEQLQQNVLNEQIVKDAMELKEKCNSGEVVFVSESYAQKMQYDLQPIKDAFSKLGYEILVLSESMKMALQRMNIQIALDPELKDKINKAISDINFDVAVVNLRNRFNECSLRDIVDMKPLDISPEIEIANLKRRLKYAKNPLERKNINRELNALYKERKYKRDK